MTLRCYLMRVKVGLRSSTSAFDAGVAAGQKIADLECQNDLRVQSKRITSSCNQRPPRGRAQSSDGSDGTPLAAASGSLRGDYGRATA
jgi:hypothetical protein